MPSNARASLLGQRAIKLLDEAPRYPEGTGIRFEVVRAKDIPLIKKLARIPPVRGGDASSLECKRISWAGY